MYQYNRGYQLTINDRGTGTLYTLDGSIGDDGLRIKFEIQKNVDNRAATNTASLKVYNLSQDTLSKLSQKDSMLRYSNKTVQKYLQVLR